MGLKMRRPSRCGAIDAEHGKCSGIFHVTVLKTKETQTL